jgi:endoglucanase
MDSAGSTNGLAVPRSVETGILDRTWRGYVTAFIQADGRVIDHERDEASTSEGQAYAMLRAVWMGDHEVFDRVWRWTKTNLATGQDGLYGYLWGKAPDGGYRLLSSDSATDADTDLGLALVLGAHRFGDPPLLTDAHRVIEAAWRHDIVTVAGMPVASAGSWAPLRGGDVVVNPSYLSPYAYRIFAGIDPSLPWAQLVSTSYRILRDCSSSPLGSAHSAGLPPNWCALDRGTGAARAAPSMPAADAYGYDAFRTSWRVAVDVLWNESSDGLAYLRSLSSVVSDWDAHGDLAGVSTHDGTRRSGADVAAVGGGMGALLALDAQAAQSAVHSLEASVADHGGAALFADPRNYYEQNWAWFGLALAAGAVRRF